MNIAFMQYIPPGKQKTNAFTVRLNNKTHSRLLAVLTCCDDAEMRRRAVMAVALIEEGLDRMGVPREIEQLESWRAKKMSAKKYPDHDGQKTA